MSEHIYTTREYLAAFLEGFCAFFQGKDFFEHGKVLLSDSWSGWVDGWYLARDERIRWKK